MHHLACTACAMLCMGGVSPTCMGQGFSDVTTLAGINQLHVGPMLMGGGVAFIDFDLDGYEDLYITGGTAADKLYRNNGDGTFTDVTTLAGILGTDTVNSMGVVAGDFNNDGFKELFITTWDGYHNLLFLNNTNGTFQEISVSAGIVDTALSTSTSLGDVNKDGLLDIYVGNYIDLSIQALNGFDYTCFANYLYINNGNNTFTESGLAYGVADTGCALSVAFTDYDGERDVDVYVANDFGKWVLPNALHTSNHPTPTYSNTSLSAGVNDSIFGMGLAIGDYDEDGDFDYYITNLGRNMLRQNQGNGTFLDYTDSAGVTNTYTDSTSMAVGWGTAFLDYDNDTYLDLIISNGFIPADSFIYNAPSNPNKLFRGTGGGAFQDVSDLTGFNDTSLGRGLAIGDYNYDGALDVIVGVVFADPSSPAHTLVYKNEEQDNNWIKISLQGVATNRDAFGSRITLYAGGRTFIREADGGSSHLSHHSSIIHFGLGAISSIDSLVVNWLNGATDTLKNIMVNQQVHLIEDSLFFTIHYQNIQMCSGDSVLINGAYQNNQGTYHDTLASVIGNDSVIHTTLTYLPVVVDTIQATLCSGDSSLIGGSFQFTSGIYTDTLLGSMCDSIVVTNLTMLNNVSNSIGATICPGEIYQGISYAADTVLTTLLVGANGCDSILTTNLAVLATSGFSIDTAICQGELWFGMALSVDTTLIDSLTNSLGCDSIIYTNIQLLAIDSVANTVIICEGDSINGQVITSDTTIIETYNGSSGCDSIVLTQIVASPSSFSNTNISVDWGDTLNGMIMVSDTVIIDTLTASNGCDSIVQFTVTVAPPLAIEEWESPQVLGLNCYPNPFSVALTIDLTLISQQNVQITIEDLVGQTVAVVFQGTLAEGKRIFAWDGRADSGVPASQGLYICRVRSSLTSVYHQVVLLK